LDDKRKSLDDKRKPHKGTVCKNPKTSINLSLSFLIIRQKKLYYKMTAGCFSRNIRNMKKIFFKEKENFKGRKVIKQIIENDNFS
jgi:hypothetical protein